MARRAVADRCVARLRGRSAASRTTSRTTSRSRRFVKPAGNRLQLLVRVPMSAMREVDFPLRGPGYLDLGRADDALRNAAKLWI